VFYGDIDDVRGLDNIKKDVVREGVKIQSGKKKVKLSL
jgi:hypothetical protein